MQKGTLLLLTICSNHKTRGGASFFDSTASILSILPSYKKDLIKHRREVFSLIKSQKAIRDELPVSYLPYNVELTLGPDFGGSEDAFYLPAIDRYQGRFYLELKKSKEKLGEYPWIHFLFFSGLYGLITKDDPVQLYSCYLPDHEEISLVWKKDNFVTSILISYMKKHDISLVIDLTAQTIFRNLFDWERIKETSRVLHAFSDQNAGPAILPGLGEFVRMHVLSKEKDNVLGMMPGQKYETEYENIYLFDSPEPLEGFPKEKNEVDLNLGSLNPRPNIPISSGRHTSVFGNRISNLNDLPVSVRDIFFNLSRCPDVLGIQLGEFNSRGPKNSEFQVRLMPTKTGFGHIYGKLLGQGKVQKIDISVTKGREENTLLLLEKLLD